MSWLGRLAVVLALALILIIDQFIPRTWRRRLAAAARWRSSRRRTQP
jgi:hypothetical protein